MDGDEVRVLAVVDQGSGIEGVKIFVDLPEFSYGRMGCAGGALTFKRHFQNLPARAFDLVVSERYH